MAHDIANVELIVHAITWCAKENFDVPTNDSLGQMQRESTEVLISN